MKSKKPIDKVRLLRSVANMLKIDPKRLTLCEHCGRVRVDMKPCCDKAPA